MSECLFSRAFAEFARQGLLGRVHEASICRQLGDALIGHVSRYSTAIEARETPAKSTPVAKPPARKRDRPRKNEVREPKACTRLQRQSLGMSIEAMLADLPQGCDVGSKRNS